MSGQYKDEEWLQDKYHNDNLSQKEISELCGCSRKTIGRWMDKLNIDTRESGEATSIAQSTCSERHRNFNWLQDKYVDESMTLDEIGELCGCNHETIRTWLKKGDIERRDFSEKENVCCGKHKDKKWLQKRKDVGESIYDMSNKCGCSPSTISKWMDKFSIDKNGLSPNCSNKHKSDKWVCRKYKEEKLSIKDISDNCGCSNSVIHRRIRELNLERGDIRANCDNKHKDRVWLNEKYISESKDMKELSNLCGCTQETISQWINKYNIDTKDGKFETGENHWNFENGECVEDKLDFRKSKQWEKLSRERKESVNWKCEYCGESGKLHTHHTEPVSMGGAKWDNNFVVLCKGCHIGDYGNWHPPQLEEYIENSDETEDLSG